MSNVPVLMDTAGQREIELNRFFWSLESRRIHVLVVRKKEQTRPISKNKPENYMSTFSLDPPGIYSTSLDPLKTKLEDA